MFPNVRPDEAHVTLIRLVSEITKTILKKSCEKKFRVFFFVAKKK